ncbi:hypothetical protein [Pseudomonas sp. MWU318]|uniref:hypothetical protein n=1 Tax=Pseudomonas sp. MWU318 TaxID=2802569 RepID=UPI0019270303|nr:hypothetical protein [Pseudomonas sp. MWU318]
MTYVVAISTILILAVSIALGFLDDNWFIAFGLAIVVVSAVTSMILAFNGGRKAAKAEKISYESYAPVIDDKTSHFIKFSAGIMGVDTRNPTKHLQDQIDELKKASFQDEKTFRSFNKLANYRIDICLAQIRYHEDVTLPKILGQGSGAIILAGILTIIGSAYLAVPSSMYDIFSGIATVLRALLIKQ